MEEVKQVEDILSYVQKITGRTDLTDLDAFEKHYHNLSDFISKKKDDFRKELEPDLSKVISEEKKKVEDSFKPVADWIKEAGVDITKVQPLAVKEFLGEQHQEIAPRNVNAGVEKESVLQGLKNDIRRTNSQDAKEEYVKKALLE